MKTARRAIKHENRGSNLALRLRDPSTKEVRNALAAELLNECALALDKFGIDRRQVVTLLRRATPRANRRSSAVTKVLRDARLLGELANEWSESPAYLGDDGRPRILPVKGRGTTFAKLSSKYFGKRPVDQVIVTGCQALALERISSHSVALLNPCILFTGNPVLMLAHSVDGTSRFLRTAVYNAVAQPGQAWPERAAYAKIPEASVDAFMRLMRQQIPGLIEFSHRWLVSNAKVGERNPTVGVQAFVFKE